MSGKYISQIFLVSVVLLTFRGLAQTIPGSLVLIGGGSESSGGWSDAPYQWAVEHSQNKRVAIVTFDSNPSNWLPDYFESLGAGYARNFIINNSNLANSQATYDSLIACDVIFFKGGDQWNYYETYKNTKVQEAVGDVFAGGGVICGTSAGMMILSEVVFTAEHGSVYSNESILNPGNYYLTLENDFLTLNDGFVFDSHFIERGRFGRMLGFLANWWFNRNEKIKGIGVDDKTALCIDTLNMGYVFGTGSAGFYLPDTNLMFSQNGTVLLTENLTVKQALHGCTIDLNNMAITGLQDEISPLAEEVSFSGNILLGGSEDLIEANQLLSFLVNHTGDTEDTVLLITGQSTGIAGQFGSAIENLGGKVLIMNAIPGLGNQTYWKNRIVSVPKYMFVNNDYYQLFPFLQDEASGIMLKNMIQNGEKTIAFIGSDSRFAGRFFPENYDQQYASYYGLIDFEQGLNLTGSSVIMPNTFSSQFDVENTAASVPYLMVTEKLQYGLWLNSNGFVHYYAAGGGLFVQPHGSFPLILLENTAQFGGISQHSTSSSGQPRQVAGFDGFTLSVADSNTVIQTGTVGIGKFEKEQSDVKVWPNPAKDIVRISSKKEIVRITVLSAELRICSISEPNSDHYAELLLNNTGCYYLRIETVSEIIWKKLLIIK